MLSGQANSNSTFKVVDKEYKYNGDEAIYFTLKEMKRLARRDANSAVVQRIAKSIKEKCKGKDDLCRAKAVFDYIYKNVKYKFDHELVVDYVETDNPEMVEFVSAPKYLLSEIFEGDCDDMSTSLASIYIALGMPVNFKIIAWKNNSFTHVYTEVMVKMEDGYWWIPSDPVIKQFAFEKAPVKKAYVYRVDNDDNNIYKIVG